MIEINLHTNVDDTKDFQRLLRQKTEEAILLYFRKEFREGRLKPKIEIVKQTDVYLKNAKLILKGIL